MAKKSAALSGGFAALGVSLRKRSEGSRPQRTVSAEPPAPLHHQSTGGQRGGFARGRSTRSGVLPPHPDLRTRPAAAAFDQAQFARDTCGRSVKDVPERFVKDVMELDTFRAASVPHSSGFSRWGVSQLRGTGLNLSQSLLPSRSP